MNRFKEINDTLIRWEDPALGVVSPAEFVALAEPADFRRWAADIQV